MVERRELDGKLTTVIEASAQRVESLGFKRKSTVLRVIEHGNAGVIEFQKSLNSTKHKIVFTVNLAVVCGDLLEPDQPLERMAKSIHGHLRERIGTLMPSAQDKWWEISEETDPKIMATEVADIVAELGAPYVRHYLDTEALIALWRSDRSPGLTRTQRDRYLQMLTSRRRTTSA